jgi:hypothetical protein
MKNLKAEDTEEMSDDDFKPEKIKKKNRKEHNPPSFEEQSNIEFILIDLKNFEELNKFKNMKSLSLMTQNIKSIDVKSTFT